MLSLPVKDGDKVPQGIIYVITFLASYLIVKIINFTFDKEE